MYDRNRLALAQCVQGGRVPGQTPRHRVASVQGGGHPEQAGRAHEVRPRRMARRMDDEPSRRGAADVLRVASIFALVALLVLLAFACVRYCTYMDAYALGL